MQAGPRGAASPRRLTKRSEFLRAARGNRAGRPSVALQAIKTDDAGTGLGFTVSKKVGNSPERNRVKRRLRAAAALHMVTTLTGSALLALALMRRRLTPDEVWAAAHVDEDWNSKQWGIDEEVAARRAARLVDFGAAAAVLAARV